MSDREEGIVMLSELRELIPQAHAAAGDLRRAIREAKSTRDAMLREVEALVDEATGKAVTAMTELLSQDIEKASAAVYAKFDRLENLLLGKEPASIRAGHRSIDELVEVLGDLSDMFGLPAVPLVTPDRMIPAAFRKKPLSEG